MPDANITKSALASSMKDLMKGKSFDKISVIDICEGCGMNRKSFYYHFKDKYDLVNWIFYTDFITLVSTKEYAHGWDLLVAVSELFYADQDFYRSAFRIEGQNSFRDYFYESMSPIVSFFVDGISESEEDRELFLGIFCDAYLAVMGRWLSDGCVQTPQVLIEKIRILFRGIARIMQGDKG